MKLTGHSSVEKAVAVTDKLDTSVEGVNAAALKTSNGFSTMGRKGRSEVDSLTSKVGTLIARLGAAAFLFSSLQVGAQTEGLEQAISFSSGKDGAKNINFVNQAADALGSPLASSYKGFQLLQGGVMGTNISAQQTRDIFWSVSEAASAMRLSSDDANGVFLAMSQIASKGKVQAEELRGQLGERLPGAFSIAARAMGVNTAQLNKMLETGKVYSDDFLPKFSAELHKTFGGAVAEASNSATANFNRFHNSVFRLKNTLFKELLPAVTMLIGAFIPMVSWIGENINAIGMLVTVFGSLYIISKAYTILLGVTRAAAIGLVAVKTALTVATTGMSVAQGAAVLTTAGLTGTFWGLNAALLANPLVWIIGLVIAVGAAVVYSWNKFESFRGFLFGMWDALKETGRFILEYLIKPFDILGKMIFGVITFDKNLIKSSINEAMLYMNTAVYDGAHRIGKAFNGGFKKGVASFNSSSGSSLFKTPDAVSSAFMTPAGGLKPPGGDDTKIKNGINGITGGGRSQKNITINLGKFFEQMVVQTENVQQGVDEVADVVTRRLLQVLNTANQAQ